ncbi:MAG: regulator SirB [Nevskiaceae bacterium]|nr:MAG: regulator SirB [Nevskiaceae bacterium]
MSCAALSLALFLLRAVPALRTQPPTPPRVLRVLPHVIDTVFLLSGLALATTIHQYPFVHGWLTAKVLGLIAYIVLGSLALKRAPTRAGRAVALAAALLTFAYIVGVAMHHDPRSWLAQVG